MHGVPLRLEARGRERCSGGDLRRHRHLRGYVTVVLRGSYYEAGDAGRYTVEPGTVLLHRPFEAHFDAFAGKAAEVLNLPLIGSAPSVGAVFIDDPDEIAVLAESDPEAAAEAIWTAARPAEGEKDWPDLLAGALQQPSGIRIGEWARQHGLHPASVSRGFSQAFKTTPQRYRAEARARLALRALANSEATLACVAASLGFSDQAHMTRAVVTMSGRSPRYWRRNVKRMQDPIWLTA